MTRLLAAALVATALGTALGAAPLQCGHGSSDPNLRTEDSAGDALWALAMDFRAKGNEEATKQTLRFLVERYPSNRHTPAARVELEGSATPASSAPPASSSSVSK